jgi:gliding motility-associated-like protein
VYTLDGADKDNYIKPVDKVYTDGVITPKQLTITDPVITKTKEYDKTLTANTTAGTLSGVVTVGSVTDAVTASAVGNYSTSTVGIAKTITVVYSLAGVDKDNYTKPVNKVYTDGEITKKSIVVKAVASDKAYDGNKNATVILSSADIFSSDNVTISKTLAEFDTKDPGTNKTVTVSGISIDGLDAFNYNLTNTTATAIANITGSNTSSIRPFVLPNAFTPNGDTKNNEFKIIVNDPSRVTLILFQIYNRNGRLMFSTNDITKGWDGRYNGIIQDMGVYFVKYKIEVSGETPSIGTLPIYLLK